MTDSKIPPTQPDTLTPSSSSSSAQPNEEVTIILADYSIKQKIGLPMKAIFTEAVMAAAQQELDKGQSTLLSRCLREVLQLKDIVLALPLGAPIPSIMERVLPLILSIKASAGMCGYPLASKIADVSYQYLGKINHFDAEAREILCAQALAIAALFAENRTSKSDTTTLMVINELEDMIEEYFISHS